MQVELEPAVEVVEAAAEVVVASVYFYVSVTNHPRIQASDK